MNTKTVGDISVLKVATALLQNDWKVLFPFGDNARYDLVIDNGQLHRVQCKTARLVKSSIHLPVVSSYLHRGRGCKAYHGEVEFIGAYCRESDRCYLIPMTSIPVGKQSVTLGLKNPSKNGLIADNFEILTRGVIVREKRRGSLTELAAKIGGSATISEALYATGLPDASASRERLLVAMRKYGLRKFNRALLRSYGLSPRGRKPKIKWPADMTSEKGFGRFLVQLLRLSLALVTVV